MSGDTDRAVEAGLREVTPLDLLWIAMWDDLRHNATGNPTGLAIIARYRPQIEAAASSRPAAPDSPDDTGLDGCDVCASFGHAECDTCEACIDRARRRHRALAFSRPRQSGPGMSQTTGAR